MGVPENGIRSENARGGRERSSDETVPAVAVAVAFLQVLGVEVTSGKKWANHGNIQTLKNDAMLLRGE